MHSNRYHPKSASSSIKPQSSHSHVDEAIHLFLSGLNPKIIRVCMEQFGPIIKPLLNTLLQHNRLPRSMKYFEQWTCPFAATSSPIEVSEPTVQPLDDLRNEIARTLESMSPTELTQYEALIDEAIYTIISKFDPARLKSWIHAPAPHGPFMREMCFRLCADEKLRRTAEFLGQYLHRSPQGAN